MESHRRAVESRKVENTSSQGYWSRDEIDEIFGWDTTIGEKTEKGWHARMCYAGRNDLGSRTSLCLSDTSTGVSWFRGPYDTLTHRQVCLRTSHNGNSRKFMLWVAYQYLWQIRHVSSQAGSVTPITRQTQKGTDSRLH